MRPGYPLAALIIANLLPIVGVLWWGWSVFSVMLLFWLENIIVGLLNIPRILFALGDHDERQRRFSNRLLVTVFFAFHYGLFTYGHGVFVLSAFGEGIASDPTPRLALQLVIQQQLQWAVAALFVSHLLSLTINYFMSGEYRRVRVKQMMKQPYSRVLVLHLGIIFGGFLLEKFNGPLLGLVVLIIIKIFVDVRAHQKEHRRLSVTMPLSFEQE